MLQQQPLVTFRRPSLDLDERPFAKHLLSEHAEGQFSGLQRPHGVVPRFDELPCPLVPDDHTAGAVVPLRDDSFEPCVVERVVLGHHRQPFDRRVVGRAFRNGPRLEHPFHLQAEVVVKMRSVMLLNDEERQLHLAGPFRAGRLRRLFEPPHGAVPFQQVRHGVQVRRASRRRVI